MKNNNLSTFVENMTNMQYQNGQCNYIKHKSCVFVYCLLYGVKNLCHNYITQL